MDITDRTILQVLQRNAKITTRELAESLHLTVTPTYERVKRLEREGVIKGYRAELDRHRLGLGLMAFCNVSLEAHHTEFIDQFEQDIQSLQEVVACYHVAGVFDYLLQVIVPDMDTYQYFVARKLAALPNIGKVQSLFVMTEVKVSTELPILKD
ncbi:MAG: Lrp/AsnC family transcriptional regulator [Saprospiraceae bacterium]|nr:Lrp/AsnC family transcriptional regulator [Saprospiraceae bacterium]